MSIIMFTRLNWFSITEFATGYKNPLSSFMSRYCTIYIFPGIVYKEKDLSTNIYLYTWHAQIWSIFTIQRKMRFIIMYYFGFISLRQYKISSRLGLHAIIIRNHKKIPPRFCLYDFALVNMLINIYVDCHDAKRISNFSSYYYCSCCGGHKIKPLSLICQNYLLWCIKIVSI